MLLTILRIIKTEEDQSESEFLYRKDIPRPPTTKLPPSYTDYETQLAQQEEKLNKELNITNSKEKIPSINKDDIFDRFLKYISLHIDDYLIDGRLGIEFQIRYFACCFIVVFIPAETSFFFPAQIIKWIPSKLKTKKFIKEFFIETELFFKFIKKESSTQFIINVVLGRSKTLFEDIEACVYAVRDIIKTPEKSIKTLLDFQLRSGGYDEFKEKEKRSL